MASFTDSELAYLATQPLGRLATAQEDGTLQVSPVTFGYNAALDTIDVSGRNLTKSKKFRNIAANGRVAFVIDDLASTRPWRPRFVEVRGWAEAVSDRPEGAVIRIHPQRVISMGIDEPDAPAHELRSNSRDAT